MLLCGAGPLLLLPLLFWSGAFPLLVLLLGTGPELLCWTGPLPLLLSVNLTPEPAAAPALVRSPEAVWLAVSATTADAWTSISRLRQRPAAIAAGVCPEPEPGAATEPEPGAGAGARIGVGTEPGRGPGRARLMPRMSEMSGARRGREREPRSAPRAAAGPGKRDQAGRRERPAAGGVL